MNDKWKLTIGIHRGTITSRDISVEECDSLYECEREVKRAEIGYANLGYSIWFATATSPDGKAYQIHRGVSYR